MKGISLTAEGKAEIEAEISELRQYSPLETDDDFINRGKQIVLEQILSSATILPVEESWEDLPLSFWYKDNSERLYPNGVIIQPKQ